MLGRGLVEAIIAHEEISSRCLIAKLPGSLKASKIPTFLISLNFLKFTNYYPVAFRKCSEKVRASNIKLIFRFLLLSNKTRKVKLFIFLSTQCRMCSLRSLYWGETCPGAKPLNT